MTKGFEMKSKNIKIFSLILAAFFASIAQADRHIYSAKIDMQKCTSLYDDSKSESCPNDVDAQYKINVVLPSQKQFFKDVDLTKPATVNIPIKVLVSLVKSDSHDSGNTENVAAVMKISEQPYNDAGGDEPVQVLEFQSSMLVEIKPVANSESLFVVSALQKKRIQFPIDRVVKVQGHSTSAPYMIEIAVGGLDRKTVSFSPSGDLPIVTKLYYGARQPPSSPYFPIAPDPYKASHGAALLSDFVLAP